MTKSILQSFWLTLKNRRLWLFMYSVNLFFGGIIAVYFYTILLAEGNGSCVLNKLVADFDFMVFSDFWRIHGSAFTSVFLAAFAFGGVYCLMNTFFAGGIFYQFSGGSAVFRFMPFLRASLKTFGNYLLLAIIMFLLGIFVAAFSGLLFVVFVKIADGGSEREYILWLVLPALAMAFAFSILAVINDYARYLLFKHEGLGIVWGFQKGISYVFRNFRTVGFYWIIAAVGVLVGLLYLMLDTAIGMRGEVTIILMVVIQQLLVLCRVFLKNWNYAFVSDFYQKHPIALPQSVDEAFPERLPNDFYENKPSDEE